MKFGVPWSVKGIRPEARETAREAARRAGVPLSEWLNAVILQQAEDQGIDAHAHDDDDAYGEDAGVHQRLDELSRRIEQMSRSGPAAYAPPPRRGRNETDTMAEMIGRLDRRLDQFANASRPMAPPLQPAMQPAMQPTMPAPIDRAVAEITARQRALNGLPAPGSPPMPAAAASRAPLPTQDISGLEDRLRQITDQIETLRRPGVEEAINALREELGEIGHALTEAMPRRAIDAIEKQIAGLSQRIAEGRQAGNIAGAEHGALANVEHGLAEVRDALHGLTPAENLVGFNEAIAGLAHKIDMIVAQKDPATLAQLDSAITTLRSLATHVASNETVGKLAAEVQTLAERVEHATHAAGGSAALDHLEQRINGLADALADRVQSGGAVPPHLEALVQSLSDKIEQLQSSRGDNVAMGHLEDRIVSLVTKLDASESRLGQLEAVERGLGDLLVHIEDMRANKQSGGLRADASPAVDELKHDIARTQDALDNVHGTLALVVDRLAAIEHGMRGEAPALPAGKLAVRAVSTAQETKKEAAKEPPREAPQHLPPATPLQMPAPQAAAPRPQPPAAQPAPAPQPAPRRRAATLPINPDLPPDLPLEPGSGPPPLRANPAARIAASEAALGGAGPAADAAPGGKSSFIAAARRAAQLALAHAPGMRAKGAAPAAPAAVAPAPASAEPDDFDEAMSPSLRARLSKRVKSLFIAASIIAIVVGGVQIAGNMLKFGGTTKTANTTKAEMDRPATDAGEPLDLSPDRATRQAAAVPPLAAPAPAQVATTPAFNLDPGAKDTSSLFNPPALMTPPAQPKNDVTGSIPARTKGPMGPLGPQLAPMSDQLPLAIGGPQLRTAAAGGDVGAAYEVALRFAEGRGVPMNLAEAAHWFERAAAKGLVPAQFRYASMLEKGQGVKKDLPQARKLYLAAAARGSAKAMHNLAVLYAEGLDGKPDYGTAVKWFQQAAERGIADSQYNLGVLAARGLGTDKNFADSYKWFALAAASGDTESAKKRDEVAARLDPQALAAAQQAVKSFVPMAQPQEATAVPKPHGGWDDAKGAGPEAVPAPVKPKTNMRPAPHAPLSLGSFTVGKQ
jgi:localization factor PodJL